MLPIISPVDSVCTDSLIRLHRFDFSADGLVLMDVQYCAVNLVIGGYRVASRGMLRPTLSLVLGGGGTDTQVCLAAGGPHSQAQHASRHWCGGAGGASVVPGS